MDEVTRKKRPSDGYGFPDAGGPSVEVVLNAKMMRKIFLWIMGPFLVAFLSAASAFIYFYHSTTAHIADRNIHLGQTERGDLETKLEAKAARKKVERSIKGHVDIKVREVKVEQKEALQETAKQLRRHQRRILHEIRSGR